ncbi:71d7f851-cb8d-4ceb-ba6f-7b8c506cf048 [Thermothielavioides terrestris]|uniref:71d7f851-cb8d-4ceb-ba6f-7b8c506cf048 n=1 Tax=Thermothielavioides terrestris TaxID=2587410 RepID=A0A446BHP5_9PEZI|nr:71d7f851-cb8d-4ceb-ba6f-7b8c506cf048 [Thermothielavioides terrestris]
MSADSQTMHSTTTPATGPTASRLPSSTPAPTSSARGSSAASKFKPKGVRRSEAERARMAEEQLRIQEQRDAEEARRLARLNRGRARARGRGRGGLFRGTLRTSAAAGPLSAGVSFGGGGGSSGSGGYAYASGSGAGFAKSEGEGKRDRGLYGVSGLIDNSRINADMLYNYVEISDEEDGGSVTSTKKKTRPIMPMGIRRVEHKEEGVTMTTAAEIEAQEQAGELGEEESDEDGLFVSGAAVGEADEPARDEGALEPQSTHGSVTVKKEDAEEGAMDLDKIPEGIKAPDSPELKKKVPVSEQKPKRKSAAPKDLESEIISEELQTMLDLFTVQGDDALGEDGAANNAALEGHMFLFQFPPVLPPLRAVPRDGASKKPTSIKAEPDDDVVMLNQPPVSIDLTRDSDRKVKKEGDGEEGDDGNAKDEGDELKEGGYLGNLVVRKSGKVELSWGGQTLQLMPGIQSNFLSTAALIEYADVKPGDTSQTAGVAYGMGKIQGSFTLAPAWADEDDWVVDPEDLTIPEQ